MLAIMGAATILVVLTIFIHYEALRLATDALPRVPLRPRGKIVFLVFVAFGAHMVEVWLYAVGFFAFSRAAMFGDLVSVAPVPGERGAMMAPLTHGFDFLYFSTVTYTSLGFGDVIPRGALRLLAGVEALNGLVLIGWSASMTYLAMEKFWPLHAVRHKPRHSA